MGDFKKSKKLDSKKSGESTDLDSVLQDIGDAEQEADEQIQTLETTMNDIKGLEEKLESVSEKLSQVEGEALQIAQREINQEIQQKESEADECRNKLQEITEEMQEKQADISEEIGNRDGALSELQAAEQECDVNLSDAKEAVSSEKETLEDANSRIEQLLGKIGNALEDSQPKKKLITDSDDPRLSVGEKYDWKLNDQDAQNFKDSKRDSTRQDKTTVSQCQGEIYGDRLATDVLQYETKLDPLAKYDSFPQGFDAVYYDKKTDAVVIAEFKGQGSSESRQQKEEWVPNVLKNIVERTNIYANASLEEWYLAKDIIDKYDKGDNIRYELFRTKFDEKNRQLYTVLEERKYLSKEGNMSVKKIKGKLKVKLDD